MRITFISRLLVGLALTSCVAPPGAALTARGARADDKARAGWLDRYAEARQGPETIDRVSQTFKVGTDGSLDLTGISGDVRVTGRGGHEIKIEATKRVRHRDPSEAKRLMNDLRVDMANVNGRVEVRTISPRRSGGSDRGMSASVDYVVSVPSLTAVAVKNISGDIVLSNLNGEVRVDAVSGDIDLTGISNLAVAKTVSGNVTARDVGGAATITLGTVSGAVIASGLKARALECGSVSGDVQLSGTQVERIDAKSVSGNIAFDGPLARGGRYAFTSHSGSVRMVLPGANGFDLDANTFSGSIRSELPVTLRAGGGDQERRRGPVSRAIRGTYGDGGAVLVIRSFSGSVVILKK